MFIQSFVPGKHLKQGMYFVRTYKLPTGSVDAYETSVQLLVDVHKLRSFQDVQVVKQHKTELDAKQFHYFLVKECNEKLIDPEAYVKKQQSVVKEVNTDGSC